MICPQCSEKIRNRVASRKSPACLKCRYQFVFFPNEEAGLNDNLFSKKLKAISPDNAYYFTLRQLYYFILNAKAVQEISPVGCLGIIFLLAGFFLCFIFLPIGIGVLILGTLVIIGSLLFYKKRKLPYDVNRFREIAVRPWELFKGKIEKLIPENDLSFNTSDYKDIMDYSFDALIITGDNETANFLIKNDFHFKNKTAIVSLPMYPKHLFPYVIDQVKKNPLIPVFLVHNADIVFAGMKDKIKKQWFPGQAVHIFDLGLHPRQIQKSKRFITFKRTNLGIDYAINLAEYSPKEQKWFKQGNYGELAFIPPLKLINILELCLNIYKEKGPEQLLKISNSIFLMGLGIGMPKKGSGEADWDFDFDSDFG